MVGINSWKAGLLGNCWHHITKSVFTHWRFLVPWSRLWHWWFWGLEEIVNIFVQFFHSISCRRQWVNLHDRLHTYVLHLFSRTNYPLLSSWSVRQELLPGIDGHWHLSGLQNDLSSDLSNFHVLCDKEINWVQTIPLPEKTEDLYSFSISAGSMGLWCLISPLPIFFSSTVSALNATFALVNSTSLVISIISECTDFRCLLIPARMLCSEVVLY